MDVAFANDKLFAVIDGVLYKRVQGDTSYQTVFPNVTTALMPCWSEPHIIPSNEPITK